MTLARLAAAIASVGIVAVLVGCGDDGGRSGASASEGGRLHVVASFYPMAEAARQVGGERVDVTNLTPAGVEPHDLELSTRQVDALQDADLVVYLGKGFQPAVAEIASRRSSGRVDVLDAVELHGRSDDGAGPDPHFWLDPTLMAKAVDDVADTLAHISPSDAETFRANARRYDERLGALDAEYRQGLSKCDRHDIVTSHAAFAYLARRYGLRQLAVAGMNPEAEPDAARLAALADDIQTRGITTVFFEELVSPKVARAMAREAGVKAEVLNPIEGLTETELRTGKDYVAVMADNLAALRAALGCR